MAHSDRPEPAILHATLVARRAQGRWCGVLLRGPSGAGKSELALRALGADWRLVADDRVRVWTSAGRLYGAAPARLAGLLEVRGLGVLPQAAWPFARLELVVDAATPDVPVERTPEPAEVGLFGVELRQVRLAMGEPSALAKLERALNDTLHPARR